MWGFKKTDEGSMSMIIDILTILVYFLTDIYFDISLYVNDGFDVIHCASCN